MKASRLTWRGALTLILFLSFFTTVGVQYKVLLRDLANFWVVSDNLNKPADAIVVLGGNLETRPRAAADLYLRGMGKLILIVNPQNGGQEMGPTMQDRAFAEVHKLGVPTASIVSLRDGVSNTYEEARSILGWAKTNNAKTIIVPTDLFHTRRVSWIFGKELDEAGIGVNVQAIKQPNYTRANWWQNMDGRAAFISEILKYLFYRVRY